MNFRISYSSLDVVTCRWMGFIFKKLSGSDIMIGVNCKKIKVILCRHFVNFANVLNGKMEFAL